MTGRGLAFVSAALCAGVLVASASASQPAASLSGFVCHTAPNRLNRYVVVTATMRPIPLTANMRMRFVLLQRVPGHSVRQVHSGDLGTWQHPRPGPLGPWAVNKQVIGLPAPAVYRLRVSFLWVDRSGHMLASQTLPSPRCKQPQ